MGRGVGSVVRANGGATHSPGRVRVGLELRVCGVWRRKLVMRVCAVDGFRLDVEQAA